MAALVFTLAKPDLGDLRAGNTGVEGVWHWDSGQPGRQVLISALVHGNELCGAWAIKALCAHGLRPRTGSLTLMLCNLAAFDRFDPQNHDRSRFVDEDMNRVWSEARLQTGVALCSDFGKTTGSTTDSRRAALLRPFVQQADWLLDLHSMHERGAPLLLTGVQPRNLALARALGAPADVVVDAGHQDGVRMRDFGRFGSLDEADAQVSASRSLLIECGFHGDTSSRSVALDMCTRFLLASGICQSADLDAQWLAPAPAQQRAVQVTHAVVARSMALAFAQPWQGLQRIAQAGTLLATDGHSQWTTPYDDCTLVMPSLRQLRPGVTVMRLAQAV